MPRLPVNRTVLGVDLIGSGSNPGIYLNAAAQKTQDLVADALKSRAITKADAVDWQHTGDGLLAAFPQELLGELIDATQVLDDLAVQHNRWHKPDIRLRLAIGIGPLPAEQGLHRTNVDCARMLDATRFRQVVTRCAEQNPEFATGLIISDKAYQDVFGGPYTELVRQPEFTRITFQHKETANLAWVRVPRFEAGTLAAFAEPQPLPGTEPPPDAEPAPGSTPGGAGGPATQGGNHNILNGAPQNVIQAGNVHGGIRFDNRGR